MFIVLQVQRPFDHESDAFTLEKIIELGLDQFAEQICEISGAASKELAIEQVNICIAAFLLQNLRPPPTLLITHMLKSINFNLFFRQLLVLKPRGQKLCWTLLLIKIKDISS